jgi:HEAT repeat protein
VRLVSVISLVFVAGSLILILLLVARRSYLARQAKARDLLVRRLRPLAIAFVESDDPASAPDLHGPEAEIFASLLGGYARLLRGAAWERIAAYFEATGGVDEQLERLRSRRAWRRATAAFTLGDMCSRRAAPELLVALGDRVRDVRMAAARSLGRLGAVEAIEPLIASSLSGGVPRDVGGLALLDVGPKAVPRLIALSGNVEPAVRSDAVELIGLLGEAGHEEPLLEHLSDPAADVRAASATALGRLGAGEARDALVHALGDRVPDVRAAAADALGQIGGRRAADALLPVARADAFEPARAAARALARIDPERVVQAASEPDAGPHLREAADLVLL